MLLNQSKIGLILHIFIMKKLGITHCLLPSSSLGSSWVTLTCSLSTLSPSVLTRSANELAWTNSSPNTSSAYLPMIKWQLKSSNTQPIYFSIHPITHLLSDPSWRMMLASVMLVTHSSSLLIVFGSDWRQRCLGSMFRVTKGMISVTFS